MFSLKENYLRFEPLWERFFSRRMDPNYYLEFLGNKVFLARAWRLQGLSQDKLSSWVVVIICIERKEGEQELGWQKDQLQDDAKVHLAIDVGNDWKIVVEKKTTDSISFDGNDKPGIFGSVLKPTSSWSWDRDAKTRNKMLSVVLFTCV